MKLLVDNILTQIKKASKREIKIIDKALSYHVPNYQFMPAFKNHRWDGKKHFLNKRWNIFPTGLLVFVSKLIKKKHFKVRIKDRRKHLVPKRKNIKKALKLLRPYQAPELKTCLKNFLRGLAWFRGILKHPTGSGKTYMAAGLIKAIKCKTLVIVNGLELLYQTKSALEEVLKCKIGVIGDAKWNPERITVATYQTLSQHLLGSNEKKKKRVKKFLETIEALIIDECHHIDKKKSGYHVICDFTPNAYYRFGFSASPLARRDLGDVQLIGDTGDIISRVNRKELEVDGWLAKPSIHVIDIDTPTIPRHTPFATVYKKGIVKHHERNDLIVQEASIAMNMRKDKVLILVQQPKHGRRLRSLLRAEGITATLLHGGTSLKKRRRVIKETNESSKPRCIIATRIFDEGVNIPDIRTLIIGGGGASTIKSIQRIGRGLRPKEGSNTLLVIEFYDMTHKFLEDHSEQRLAAYKQEGFEIVRQQ